MVSKRKIALRLGPFVLALGLGACGLPAEKPATFPLGPRFEAQQAPQERAPALWFETYGRGLVLPRWSHTADVLGSWLYVVGGSDVDGQMGSVERAPILEGGALGDFQQTAVSLLTPRDCHASLVVGRWLYVIGGDARGSLDSIERAPIGAGGTLGDFQAAGTRLATARDEHTATRIGRYVYVIGGIRGPVQLDSIERAEVRADGSLGPFARYGRSLTARRYGHWVIVRGDSLYVVGGLSDNSDSAVVERARIQPDGELGSFERLDTRLEERRDSPIAVDLGGWLYVIGGAQADAVHIKLSSIEAAPLGAAGLGSFRAAGGLREGRDYHTVTRVGSWLYAIAGERTYGGAIGSVERVRIPSTSVSPSRSDRGTPPPRVATPAPRGHEADAYGGDAYEN